MILLESPHKKATLHKSQIFVQKVHFLLHYLSYQLRQTEWYEITKGVRTMGSSWK